MRRALCIFVLLIGLFVLSINIQEKGQLSSYARLNKSLSVDGRQMDIYYFGGEGCPHCSKVEPFIAQIEHKYSLQLHRFDIYNNRENLQLLNDYFDKYHVPLEKRGIPAIFTSDFYIIGDVDILNSFEEVISRSLNSSDYSSSSIDSEKSVEPDLSLLSIAVAALADSINPCSIAILLFLMTGLLLLRKRERALKVGYAFALSVFVANLFFGMGILTTLGISNLSSMFKVAAGSIAILTGILLIKDCFFPGSRFVMEVPHGLRPLLKRQLSKAFFGGSSSIIGIFFVGFLVTSFEVPCTGGPYFYVLARMAEDATRLQTVPVLLLYNVLFITPLILISTLLYFGTIHVKKVIAWKDRNKQLVNLMRGSMMLLLGLFTIPTATLVQLAKTILNIYTALFIPIILFFSLYVARNFVSKLTRAQVRGGMRYARGLGVFIAVLSFSLVLVWFLPLRAFAHVGSPLSAWASAPPTIDGVLGAVEWASADRVAYTTWGGISGVFYVMNDNWNLYIAVTTTDPTLSMDTDVNDRVILYFDNDHDGLGPELGDDIFGWSGWMSEGFFDSFSFGTYVFAQRDSDYGGTSDGAAVATSNGTHNHFEIVHPLNSVDNAHDFSLGIGSTVGFGMRLVVDGWDKGWWPPDIDPAFWGDIVISPGFCYNYTESVWIDPPATGDWVIWDNIGCSDAVITLNGNLSIYGILGFGHVTLRMNSTFMGQYGIEVNTGGAFHVAGGVGAPSVITNGDNATAYYTFQVRSGALFKMTNSELHNAGFAWNLPDYSWAGLWINTDHVVMYNNLISNNHFIGILLYHSGGHYIFNNTITGNDWHGIWGENSPNNLIENNKIFSNGQDGIALSSAPNNQIYDNTIYKNGLDGISLSSASGSKIYNNTVYSNGRSGIVVSSGTSITFNNASSNGDDGIVVSSSSGSLIDNNIANGNGDNGIVVSSSASSRISDNAANKNKGGNGIAVGSSPFSDITNNTANGNGNNGIGVSSSESSNIWNNTANYNGDDGIVVSSSPSIEIWDNIANYNFVEVDIGTGIVVDSSPSASVTNNEANSNWRGIHLVSSPGSVIYLNVVNNNTWYGIHLYLSPTTKILENDVSLTKGEWDSAGVYLSYSEGCILQYNDVISNYNGMILWNSPEATIQFNEVNSNSLSGISLQFSGDATVSNNNAHLNSHGIALSSSNYVDIDTNNATSNGVGISLSSSHYVTITNNNASNNGRGISLGGSNNNAITFNHVESNTYGIYLTSSSSNVIADNIAEDNDFGVSLWWSSNYNSVKNNDFDNSEIYGAYVFSSSYNSLTLNDLRYSGSVGIHLEQSHYNGLYSNNATHSGNYGINLFESDWNEVENNDVRFSTNVGIGLSSSHNNNILNNTAEGSGIGISLRWSNGNNIRDNNANLDSIGISLLQSNTNAIINNTASSNKNIGIELSISSYNDLINNTADNNANYGIHLYSSTYNDVIGNNVNSNGVGVYLDWSTNNVIRENVVNFNSLVGIAIYWESNNNQIIGNDVDSNSKINIRLSFSHNNIVEDNEASNSIVGVYLDWSKFNQIVNNTANFNTHGISLEWFSNNNQIIDNTATNNLVGISLEFSSYNTITGNDVSMNEIAISLEWYSDYNIITGNTNQGTIGISLYRSNYNKIKQNKMLDNTDYDVKAVSSNYNSIINNVACKIYSDTITNTITGNTCPYHPYISIYADKTAYTTGNKMYVGLNITNPAGNKLVGIYIWIDLPNGAKYWVIATSITLPAGWTYSNPTFISFTLPPLTPGQYAWHAVILDPAAGKILSESVWPWTFSTSATNSIGTNAETRIGDFYQTPVISRTRKSVEFSVR